MDITVYKNWNRETGTGRKFSMRFPEHRADPTSDYKRKEPFIILQNNGDAIIPLWPLNTSRRPGSSKGSIRSSLSMKWSPEQLSVIKKHFESTIADEDDETYIPGTSQKPRLMFRFIWRGGPILLYHVDRETKFYIPDHHPIHQIQPKLSDTVIQQEIQDMYEEIFDIDDDPEEWDVPIAQLADRRSPDDTHDSSTEETSGSDGGSPDVEFSEVHPSRQDVDTCMAIEEDEEMDDGPSILVSSAKRFHESWGKALDRIGANSDAFPLKQRDFIDYVSEGGTVIDLFKHSSAAPDVLLPSQSSNNLIGSKWKQGGTITRKGRGWIMVEDSDDDDESQTHSSPTKTRRDHDLQSIRHGIQCEAAAVWTKWGWKETTKCGMQFANAGLEYESHIKRDHLQMVGRKTMKSWAKEQLVNLKALPTHLSDEDEDALSECDCD